MFLTTAYLCVLAEVYATFYVNLMLSNVTANGDKWDFHNRQLPTKVFTVSSTGDKGDNFNCLRVGITCKRGDYERCLCVLQQGHGHHTVVEDAQHALVQAERAGAVQLGWVHV